jgi:hypothetical protein
MVAACGCENDRVTTAPSPSLNVSIGGQAVNYRTNSGISGAVVRFVGEERPIVVEAITDRNGSYTMTLPIAGFFSLWVAGARVGAGHVTSSAYRGDLFVNDAACIARYGTLADARTLRPIAGATVHLAGNEAVSGLDGWYRLDFGCPSTRQSGNTTYMAITHPNYARRDVVVGRGVQEVDRVDVDLEPLR